MAHHTATAQTWGGEWRAGCNQCGWIQRGSATRTETQAKKAAERHNVKATEQDERVHKTLFGPRGK